MRRDYGSVGTIALRASALLQAMSRDIEAQRKEFNRLNIIRHIPEMLWQNCLS